MNANDWEHRIQALEARVGELEADRTHRPAAGSATGDGFWALDVLATREGAPYEADGVAGGLVFAGRVATPGTGEIVWQEEHPLPPVLEADWSDAAPILSALGHPIRLELIKRMLLGAHTTQELTATPGLGTSGQLYHHLKELQSAGLVVQRRRSQYAVNPERVIPCLVLVAAAGSGGRLAPPGASDDSSGGTDER